MNEQELDIYNRGIAEGKKHQAPSKQTADWINRIEEELKDAKEDRRYERRAFKTFLVASVASIMGIGIWVGTIQASIGFLGEQIENRTEDRFYRQDGDRLETMIQANARSIEHTEEAMVRIEEKIDRLLQR